MDYLIKTIYAILATCAIYVVLVMATTFGQAIAGESDVPDWHEDTLAGDWNEACAKLYKKSIDSGFSSMSLANLNAWIAGPRFEVEPQNHLPL